MLLSGVCVREGENMNDKETPTRGKRVKRKGQAVRFKYRKQAATVAALSSVEREQGWYHTSKTLLLSV